MKRTEHAPPGDATAPAAPGNDDQSRDVTGPEAEVESTSELAAIEAQLSEAKNQRLRLAAEFDNYRKRMGRELQEVRLMARMDAIMPILNVFDHFRLAMAAAAADADPKVLRDGMSMILGEFEKALADVGIETVEADGIPFDPQIHEAVAREPSPTVPENHVIRQWRCGYRIGERLLRPATVVVSAGPDSSADEAQTPGLAPPETTSESASEPAGE